MNPNTAKLATLLGSASFVTLAASMAAHAQQNQQLAQAQMAQATPEEIPEQVLITGSLIRGTAAVGVPVTKVIAVPSTVSVSLFAGLPLKSA